MSRPYAAALRRSRRRVPRRRSASTLLAAACAALVLVITACAEPPDPDAQLEAAAAPDAQERGTYAFENVSVVPLDRERVLEGQTVVVRDGRIQAVGPAGSVEVPEGAVRIDGEGRWLLPGMAEMHAHVPPAADPPRQAVEDILFLFAANGITTIRGMLGSPYQLELREEIRRGDVLGPTFYVGAPSLNANTAPDPESAEARVREHAAAGYDFLKIHPGVPLDAWDRMVEVADEVGISYGGHVPADVGLHHAVASGMTTVDHLDGFLQATRRDGVEPADGADYFGATDPEKLDEVVRFLAGHEVWLVPTQYLWNHLFGYVDPDDLLSLPEFRYVSPETRQAYRQSALQRRESGNITPESDRAHREMRQEFLRAAHAGGVPILMGTDSPQLFNVPGFALHHEIPLMLDAGMSPYEVLVSGSRNVADYVERVLGQPGDFGTVEVGKRADLLLVDGNPLESLDVLRDPAGVMLAGRWLSADEIRQGLEALERRHAAN